MDYPLVLSSHKRIVIAPYGWFDSIGRVDLVGRTVEIGVNRLGERSLAWFLDAAGRFFPLEWRGRLPKSLLQKFGLLRERELYSIGSPLQITAGELLDLIADHTEQFEEARNTAGLRNNLLAVPSSTVLGREFMCNYLRLPQQGAA